MAHDPVRLLLTEAVLPQTNVWSMRTTPRMRARAPAGVRQHLRGADDPETPRPTGAWWLLRQVLAEQLDVPFHALSFEREPTGQPVLSEPWASSGLCFSLTRTDGAVAVAVTSGAAVGVDLERERPVPLAARIAARFFAPEESARLASTPEPRRSREFLTLWTMKEAAAKAYGEGLASPTAVLSRAVPPGFFRDDHARWVCRRLPIGEGWLGAVVVGLHGGIEPHRNGFTPRPGRPGAPAPVT